MRYTYTAAWTVVGGLNLPVGSPSIELVASPTHRFLLTSDSDPLLLGGDRATAFRRLALRKVFGHIKAGDVGTLLPGVVQEVTDERRKKTGSSAVLICQAKGEAAVKDAPAILNGPDFAVLYEAADTGSLRRDHQATFDAFRVALALMSRSLPRFRRISECVEFCDEAGVATYSVTLEMHGEASVSMSMRAGQGPEIADCYRAIGKTNDLRVVHRLFAAYSDAETDNLRRFLAGWAALEMFVNKRFAEYREAFMSPLVAGGNPGLRKQFLRRLNEVMKGRYKPVDKFLAIAAVLLDDVPEAEVEKELDRFGRLAACRNRLYHGKEVDERSLPLHELGEILRKCLVADLRHRAKAVSVI